MGEPALLRGSSRTHSAVVVMKHQQSDGAGPLIKYIIVSAGQSQVLVRDSVLFEHSVHLFDRLPHPYPNPNHLVSG